MNFEWQIPHLTQEKLNRTLAKYFLKTHGTSLAIQQLRIRASTTEDTGSIPGHEMKIPYAAQGGGKRVGGQGSESSVLNITNFKIHHNESLSLQLTLEPYIYTHTHNYRNKWNLSYLKESFLVAQTKASAYNEGDLGLIPGLGRSPGEGNGNPLQYSCLEDPMDGGAW